MQRDLGQHLFTFAVISDSHVNEGESRSVSPYASNRQANGRLRHVVDHLNRLDLAFVVHLGDMGNPLPELPGYESAAKRFREIVSGLRAPLHLTAGNHCVGDKPQGWVPVPRVSSESLARYERVYGRHFYAFDHGDCQFLVLSSLIVNSGLPQEGEQKAWLEQELARAGDTGRRVWLMMHYPLFVAAADEPGSYDNLDLPGRSWLLSLLEEHDVEAVFSGHVHNYFYSRYAGTDLITVPATSFVRQDYSDVFRVAPADPEGGRSDLAKLGFCLVDVFERGHSHRIVRTAGRSLVPGEAQGEATTGPPATGVPQSTPTGVGVEMRENWLARLALRTNNSVSPFTRRSARNDWAVLALREMGATRVRLFLHELLDEDVIERVSTLQEAGFEFLVYSHGIPGEKAYRLVREHRALMAGWELVLRHDQVESAVRRLEKVNGSTSVGALPCYLNEVRDLSRAEIDDANVKHEAVYGFQIQEKERIEALVRDPDLRRTFRGLVFRLRRRGVPELSLRRELQAIDASAREWGMHHQAHVLFSGSLTADRLVDDLSTANRVAEAALIAAFARHIDLTLDTFEDVDRGYFVRHGLVDRRYNPRLAAKVLRHLGEVLGGRTAGRLLRSSATTETWGRSLTVELDDGVVILLAPSAPGSLDRLPVAGRPTPQALRLLDLECGETCEVAWATDGPPGRLAEPVALRGPMLVIDRSE
ncbi:MAG: metallophosphoesterase [Acidobacteriota bacterium]